MYRDRLELDVQKATVALVEHIQKEDAASSIRTFRASGVTFGGGSNINLTLRQTY